MIKGVRFDGGLYWVHGVAKGAFNTRAGAKVRTLSFDGKLPDNLGPYAFAGMKSLKKLVASDLNRESVDKRAFSGFNKRATIVFTRVPSEKLNSYRKYMVKHGLPKSVRVISTMA